MLENASKVDFDMSVKDKWRIPANLHIGCMGLAPSEVH
jgi:hypothetical protein